MKTSPNFTRPDISAVRSFQDSETRATFILRAYHQEARMPMPPTQTSEGTTPRAHRAQVETVNDRDAETVP